jgi:predicted tellurium resistance membrane protein TerC
MLSLSWVMGLTNDLFDVFGEGISGRDLVLLSGGLFLLYKASHEIFVEVEAKEEGIAEEARAARGRAVFWSIIGQIAIMVGMALTAEAFDFHVPKGYIYAAMAFSLGVEALNIRARKKRQALERAAA